MVLAFTGMLAQADDHATPTQPVGMVYAMDVSDPPAFAAAMAKYWDSPTGKQSGGIAILRQAPFLTWFPLHTHPTTAWMPPLH